MGARRPPVVGLAYESAFRTTAIKRRISTTTVTKGTRTWKTVMTPELTEVRAVVAIAVKAPGRMKAATYTPSARKITSTISVIPSFIAVDDKFLQLSPSVLL